MGTLTEVMGEFISQLRFEDLPNDVVERARLTLLDSIGCALGGSSQNSIHLLEDFILSSRGNGGARIFGSKNKASLLDAVLLNASRADAQEFSDVNKLTGGHPGCIVVPTALNVAEEHGGSGRDLLLAIVSGYDAHRLAIPLYPQAFRDGLHLVMFGGTFGSCAAAGKTLKLGPQQMSHALGICGVVPVAPFEPCRTGGYTKDLYTGWAAMTGAFSALLAKKGFTGTRTLFEGELGLYRALRAQKDPLTALEGLGREWVIRKSCIKPHASCRFTHSSADAALALVQEERINPNEIEGIKVVTDTVPYQLNRGAAPKDAIDARFSIPFVVATVLLKKRSIEIKDFDDSELRDETISGLAKKIEVQVDKDLDEWYPEPPTGEGFRTAIMEVRFKNGTRISKRVDYPKGDPNNPVSYEEVEEKFLNQAQHILGSRQTDRIIEIIHHVEELDQVNAITSLLIPE